MPGAGMSAVTGMWALPLLAAQAVRVRLSTPRLPEASAPHTGTAIGSGLLPDRPYRLAVVGESTAAARGAALDRASQQVAATRPRVLWVDTNVVMVPEFFSADRFHPSALGYQHWAQIIADHVVATPVPPPGWVRTATEGELERMP